MEVVVSFIVAAVDAWRLVCFSALPVLGVLALAIAWRSVRGTTLAAAWWWALASLGSLSICELVAACSGDGDDATAGWLGRLRYAAAITTFAPTMAALGAKRPQHRAWQFIVLTLLAILALPSLQAALFAVGNGPLDLHAARRWFLAVLIAVGVVNYLPTRCGPASFTYALAQVFLLANHLPLIGPNPSGRWPIVGLVLMVAAFWLVALGWPGRRRRGRQGCDGVDRLWLDFRDAYGMVWALRVQERYNATAAKDGWAVRLGWRGLIRLDPTGGTDSVVVDTAPSLDSVAARSRDGAALEIDPDGPELRGLTSLLRRFVSREWIAWRLDVRRGRK